MSVTSAIAIEGIMFTETTFRFVISRACFFFVRNCAQGHAVWLAVVCTPIVNQSAVKWNTCTGVQRGKTRASQAWLVLVFIWSVIKWREIIWPISQGFSKAKVKQTQLKTSVRDIPFTAFLTTRFVFIIGQALLLALTPIKNDRHSLRKFQVTLY